ncbi:MAG: hypothetical protein LC774_14610 [Acidobacteria bacterium]|nr:hypothetical protein [Acidobacteriota bacterium]
MSLMIRSAWSVVAVICFVFAAPVARAQAPPEKVNAAPANEANPLRTARSIFIRTKSVYFKPEALENSLLEQEEFQRWGLSVTRIEAEADLVIEVGRKVFTTSFIYSVIEPRSQKVVASGRVNSIGGTVEGKIRHSFIKKLRAARQQ